MCEARIKFSTERISFHCKNEKEVRGTEKSVNIYLLVKGNTGRKRCSSMLGCRRRIGRLPNPLYSGCDVSGLCFYI